MKGLFIQRNEDTMVMPPQLGATEGHLQIRRAAGRRGWGAVTRNQRGDTAGERAAAGQQLSSGRAGGKDPAASSPAAVPSPPREAGGPGW